MNIEDFRTYCLEKQAVTESFPFDNSTLVFKVANKMFALADVDAFDFVNLKCDPEEAIVLRETFSAVKPGYHMNKSLWNSVYPNQDLPDARIYQLIDDSYNLIVASLTKKVRLEFSL